MNVVKTSTNLEFLWRQDSLLSGFLSNSQLMNFYKVHMADFNVGGKFDFL